MGANGLAKAGIDLSRKAVKSAWMPPFRCEPEMRDELQRLSKRTGRPVSDYLRQATSLFLQTVDENTLDVDIVVSDGAQIAS